MKEIPTTPPYPTCLLFRTSCSLATAVNYLVRIAPIVYLAFQARPSTPMGAQPDSGMGHGTNTHGAIQQYLDRKASREEGNRKEGNDVTNDKLLLTMLIGKLQLHDLNPDTLWAASLQDQPPADLWAQTRVGFDFGESP
ncbi:hypothetical protein DSO57_1035941 [Entomophthora muscae]|uniref:Uncharacterized protein n=1 Tax=Entomophthora muscae TaxID=34485 RepID=A0ACC2SNR0_9FUNG|nr:hypothetical protein DSO57_1035941 [Entomophthora muscae]